MGPKKSMAVISAFTVCLLISCITACRNTKKVMNPALGKYIEAYTAGVISRQSTIRVQLTNNVNVTHTQNEPVEDEIFSFSPNIKGKAYWVDATTVEFRPDANLDPGKTYNATFKLGKITKVEKDLKEFGFEFRVIKPSYALEEYGLKSAGNTTLNAMTFTGAISTADVEDPQQIEKVLTASYGGKTVPVTWQHNAADKVSRFTISNLIRQKNARNLELSWDGKPLKVNLSGKKTIEVPAISDFEVMDVRAVAEDEQYVLVQFSDPISVAQTLDGLIGVSGVSDLRYAIEGSEVKVFPSKRLEGNYTVVVNEGILNAADAKLEKSFSANINFENILPSVTIPGKGVILPESNKLVMPFEAVNLSAVDVTIIKIYENNVPQYLQQNGLDGNQELRRVGRPIVEKTIRLDADKSINLHKRNRFFLDMEKLLRTEPGAIYRVTIGFRKSYSLMGCSTATTSTKSSSDESDDDYYEGYYYGGNIDEDDDFWKRYDSYYPYGYSWDEREDPCTNSYYNKNRWAARNVFSSNIGLIAKRGNDNSMLIAVTDIRDTKPLIGVDLELLDYQNQVIYKTKSDGEGLATFDLKRKPYILIAKKGDERGYLKLDDGSSLPLGRFDVKGEEVQSGIKGFLYGERGVWRPGDTLFLTFILEDKQQKLPADHPVTLEIYNPKGQLYKQLNALQSVNGFYRFTATTSSDVPTGTWVGKVKVGGAVFTKNLRIETVKPNRLKIKLDFGSHTTLSKTNATEGNLSALWLFGATAQNLKAKVDVSLSSQTTSFKDFKAFRFDDPITHFETENKTIFEGSLGDNGTAPVKVNLPLGKLAPGQLKANFEIKVFEPGGDFSIDHFSMPYNPFASYAGLQLPQGDRMTGMLLTDKQHPINIVNVDENGNLLKGSQQVQVELYKIRWRWWWDENSENEFSNFTQDSYNQLLKKETVTLQNGKGSWNLQINYPDWGRYLVRVKDLKSGHTSGQSVYIDWPGWAERVQKDNPSEASMLVFTSDKTKYNVGEDIHLTIPSSEGGRGLVSIESGSKVLKTFWINTQKGQTTYSFKADKDMAPNVYVNVTLLQPHAQTLNDLPIRMYGVIPISIEDGNTILQPVIAMPDKLEPEQSASITVSEAKGKAMTYTIALVDEGLLDLTRFKTPDPHSVFYAREALGVKSWDLFDYVIGAWGGDMERILSIGGDEGLNKNAGTAKANRFKPVVLYMGPFTLKGGQKQTHNFKLPPYIGSVKAMVVAGQDGAYGTTEKAVAVKKPLMLLTSLPRVLGPSETIQLPVTVFGLENNIRTVKVSLNTSPLLEVVGEQTKTVNFAQPGEQIVYFDVRVKPQVGVAKVKVTATSGAAKAEDETQLEIRNPNPVITTVQEATLQGGQSWSAAYRPAGMAGTNTGTLEVSTIPALNLAKRLNYLIQYPHGCVEQTTSSVFPQLALNQVMDLKQSELANIEKNIKAGINRLKGFQTSDGGMGYWPGAAEADEWGTNYAGNFLLEAQAKGYELPASMLEQWKKYQRNKAASWAPSTTNFYGADLTQAYRLYLLALAKVPELGAMNRLKEFRYLSDAAKWRLAAAYKLSGQPELANSIVKSLPTDVQPYKQLGGTFGSDLRDKAMILETLTILGQHSRANELVRQIAANLSQDSWYSTQTTAYSLIAIAKFCGSNTNGSKMSFSYTLNGASNTVNGSSYVTQIPVTISNAEGNVSIQNKGQNILYVRLILQGCPDAGQEPNVPNNPDVLDIQVKYSTRDGKQLDPASLRQGSDFMATVTIHNPGKRGHYDQMALTQIFPSGWEIINTRLMDNDNSVTSSPFTYKDIRDDRVYTYFNIEESKTRTYNVLLNAAYLGRYYLPAVSCEAMYDNTIQAFLPGKWVEVIK